MPSIITETFHYYFLNHNFTPLWLRNSLVEIRTGAQWRTRTQQYLFKTPVQQDRRICCILYEREHTAGLKFSCIKNKQKDLEMTAGQRLFEELMVAIKQRETLGLCSQCLWQFLVYSMWRTCCEG